MRRFAVGVARRLWGEAFTRAGRRRLRRRVASRYLLVFVAIAWTYPTVEDFWYGQIVDFVAGRVVLTGPDPGPVLRTAVVLVPAPDDPDDLASYAAFDISAPDQVADPVDLQIDIWPDLDGYFSRMTLAPRLPYRIEVRRPGCPTLDFGVRSFFFLNFWSRRLRLEVPPCPRPC